MHQFNACVAVRCGILEAVILQNLYFWIEKNKANDQNIFEDKCWTYNSIKAFTILFPYATDKMIRTAIDHLVDEGLVETGNFNKNKYDRTLWYTITNEGYSILLSGQIHLPVRANGIAHEGEPIPYNKPDIKPDNIVTKVTSDVAHHDEDDKKLEPKEYGNHEINSLMEYFESQTGIVANRAKANRNACYNLIRSRTYDGAKVVVDLVAKAIKSDDLYAPRISSFRDLQGQYEKLSKLEAWNAHKAAMTASEPPTMRSPANFYKTFDFTVKDYTPEEIAEQDAERAKVSQQIKEARAKMPFLNKNKGKGNTK